MVLYWSITTIIPMIQRPLMAMLLVLLPLQILIWKTKMSLHPTKRVAKAPTKSPRAWKRPKKRVSSKKSTKCMRCVTDSWSSHRMRYWRRRPRWCREWQGSKTACQRCSLSSLASLIRGSTRYRCFKMLLRMSRTGSRIGSNRVEMSYSRSSLWWLPHLRRSKVIFIYVAMIHKP